MRHAKIGNFITVDEYIMEFSVNINGQSFITDFIRLR